MNKGVLFQEYKGCYDKARSRNTVLTESEKKRKKLFLWIGAILGAIVGFFFARTYFNKETWSYQGLITQLGSFGFIFLLLYSFDVHKAIKVFKNNWIENLKGILKGDWRTQSMKKDEQINFKENLIKHKILLKDNEQENHEILEADIQYFLSIAGRKALGFKANFSLNTKIIVFFMGGLWATYIKDISENNSLLNAIFISLMLLVLILSFRIYINRIVLDEARECLVICDELTEIKNDIIRKEN